MDILYITKQGRSQCNDMELKWSLRSIETFGRGIDRVFVVGWCPDWLSDEVVKIPYETDVDTSDPTNMRLKALDIAKKVLYVIDNTDIGDDFLVSMDDHFYVRDVDFNEYPVYAKKGNEIYLPEDPRGGAYVEFLYNCRSFLIEKFLPVVHFAPHRNMHVTRAAVTACRPLIEEAERDKKSIELFILLNNYRLKNDEIPYTPIRDIKIRGGEDWWKTDPELTEVFSTVDFNEESGLYSLMEGRYPNKSKYEIDE